MVVRVCQSCWAGRNPNHIPTQRASSHLGWCPSRVWCTSLHGFLYSLFNLSGFGRWGEVFGDDVVAAAMIDRLVHHAEVVSMKGDSCRLKDRDLGRVPAATKTND